MVLEIGRLSTQTLSRLVLNNDISPSLTVFALCSVKTEHSIRMRNVLSEANSDKKLASGALLLVLASLLKTRLIVLAVIDIP